MRDTFSEAGLSPSPGTPGRAGVGAVLCASAPSALRALPQSSPQPNPPPDYQGRGKESPPKQGNCMRQFCGAGFQPAAWEAGRKPAPQREIVLPEVTCNCPARRKYHAPESLKFSVFLQFTRFFWGNQSISNNLICDQKSTVFRSTSVNTEERKDASAALRREDRSALLSINLASRQPQETVDCRNSVVFW